MLARIISTTFVVTLLALTAHAGSYGEAGCGPGSLIIQQNTFVSQTSAQTTNGISSPTKLGSIWSHTSNCSSTWSEFKPEQRERFEFIADHYEFLKGDVARGQGENLSALQELHGCSEQQHNMILPHIRAMMNAEFDPQIIADQSNKISQLCRRGGES